MEKKPVKRNENLAKLSRDHHASLMFCWKLRQGIKQHAATERMVKYVQYFLNHHFNPHFKEEEEILFAGLDDSKVQKAIDDHVFIKSSIHKILTPDSGNQPDKLSALANSVDEHVRYEERILFPHLENKLNEEQLKAIGELISDEVLKDNYEDEFWIKNKSL
ncbi:MAG: hemerythrin domain-containing protein [Ginsengibacter sp.]